MQAKYIFTADDYGPIDFINKGIQEAVSQQLINSVHILVNVDDVGKLKSSLQSLADSVTSSTPLSIGLHLTLTSGKPLYPEDSTDKKQVWGDLLDDDGFFASFIEFNLNPNIELVTKEFAAQKERLINILSEINSDKLVFNSISSHHNVLTTSRELTEAYLKIAGDLNIRSPKLLPKSKQLYYKIVGSANDKNNEKQTATMRKLDRLFRKNIYYGSPSLEISSPNYIDGRFYKATGVVNGDHSGSHKLKNRLNKMAKIVKYASDYKINTELEPADLLIIEFPFHLGDINHEKPVDKNLVKHYKGITHLFFDDRQVELKTLIKMKELPEYQNIFANLTNWNTCQKITYKSHKED